MSYMDNLIALKAVISMGDELPDGMGEELGDVFHSFKEDMLNFDGALGAATNEELVEAVGEICTSWGYPNPCSL